MFSNASISQNYNHRDPSSTLKRQQHQCGSVFTYKTRQTKESRAMLLLRFLAFVIIIILFACVKATPALTGECFGFCRADHFCELDGDNGCTASSFTCNEGVCGCAPGYALSYTSGEVECLSCAGVGYSTDWNSAECTPCPDNTEAVFFAPYTTCQCAPGFQPTVTEPELAPAPCAPCPPQYYFQDTDFHNDASQPVSSGAPGCLLCDGPPQDSPTFCYSWQPVVIAGFIGLVSGTNCSTLPSSEQAALLNGIDGIVIIATDGIQNWTTYSRQGRFAFVDQIVISQNTTFTVFVELASRPELQIGGWPNSQFGVAVSNIRVGMIELSPEGTVDNINFCYSSCVQRWLL